MAEWKNLSGREGTPPLWASSIAPGGGLTFNAGNLPSLLVPVNQTAQLDPGLWLSFTHAVTYQIS